MAQTFESIFRYPAADVECAREALERAVGIVREDLGVFTEKFPSSNSFGGFYEAGDNVEWTTGFWTGSVGLSYEDTE